MEFRKSSKLLAAIMMSVSVAAAAEEKPQPDAQFGNWLYKTPDPKTWRAAEKGGALVFAVELPPGDFCTITLFPGAKAEADFTRQFEQAVSADQKAKGSLRIEADGGNEPRKAAEGFDVITRRIQAETAQLHTHHFYLAGNSGGRFELAAFQTSSEEMWQNHGAQASALLLSLKLANSLPPERVAALVGKTAAPKPPSLPGFDAPPAATPPAAQPAAPPLDAAPVRPIEQSEIVAKNTAGKPAVSQKSGQPIDGVKLSQHDKEIFSPAIAVAPDGTIHVAFVEKHRTTFAFAVYHRSSTDGGKTWSEAKNLSEPMPNWPVGNCALLVDAANRAYVIWRTGLREGLSAEAAPGRGTVHNNLVYRVLEGGKWSARPLPVHPPGSAQTQDNGSLSWFAALDPAGQVHVVWNTTPDRFHPELMMSSGGTFRQHLSGIGNGLVFEAVLNGADAGQPREIYMTKIEGEGWNRRCDELEALQGYIDRAGAAHLLASVKEKGKYSPNTRVEMIEDGRQSPALTLPGEPRQLWSNPPRLLLDAQGRRHIIVCYTSGERPGFRDYLFGTEEEPIVIRAAPGAKGAEYFQAYQAPGGRMIVVMQGDGETYVSMGDGTKWSEPVNVTNNSGRQEFWSRRTSSESSISSLKRYYPGPAAAAIDREGRLLLAMVNNESTVMGERAFGVNLGGAESTTPALTFLRF